MKRTLLPQSTQASPLPSAKRQIKRLRHSEGSILTSQCFYNNHTDNSDFVYLGPEGVADSPPEELPNFVVANTLSHTQKTFNTTVKEKRVRRPRQRRVSDPLIYTSRASSSSSSFKKKKPINKIVSSIDNSNTTAKDHTKKDNLTLTNFTTPIQIQEKTRSLEECMESIAEKWFGIKSLNNFQKAAIGATLQRKNAFIVVPTGAGKSLCYQLPPLMEDIVGHKFTLVISPLISLMEDQIMALQLKQIPAISLSGSRRTIWEKIKKRQYKIVYASPEYVELHSNELQTLASDILLIAIDECHCVSDWGHNFRPSYRRLVSIRSLFPDIPLMCLTATATSAVCSDIQRLFGLSPYNTITFRGSVNRSNIFYSVIRRGEKLKEDLGPVLALDQRPRQPVDNSIIGPNSSTVIYVATKEGAETMAKTLQLFGVVGRAYHAGLSNTERSEVHRLFLTDQIQIVCATVAFGMGIDKPDIRRVIHWCLPTSIEAFCQQSGRAGRDGIRSESILMWAPKDESRTRNILLMQLNTGGISQSYKERSFKLFEHVTHFVQTENICRRKLIMEYFGETVNTTTIVNTNINCNNLMISENTSSTCGVCHIVNNSSSTVQNPIICCNLCDVCCGSKSKNYSSVNNNNSSGLETQTICLDFTKEAKLILSCIVACKERTGALLPCKLAIGSKSKEILSRKLDHNPLFGKGSKNPIHWWKELLSLLKRRGYTEEKLSGNIYGKRQSGGHPQYLILRLTSKGRYFLHASDEQFIETNVPKVLCPPETKNVLSTEEKSNIFVRNENNLLNAKAALRKKLMDLRICEARARQCAPFMILPMPSIECICDIRPSSIVNLLKIIPQISLSPEFQNNILTSIDSICNEFSISELDRNVTSSTINEHQHELLMNKEEIELCEPKIIESSTTSEMIKSTTPTTSNNHSCNILDNQATTKNILDLRYNINDTEVSSVDECHDSDEMIYSDQNNSCFLLEELSCFDSEEFDKEFLPSILSSESLLMDPLLSQPIDIDNNETYETTQPLSLLSLKTANNCSQINDNNDDIVKKKNVVMTEKYSFEGKDDDDDQNNYNDSYTSTQKKLPFTTQISLDNGWIKKKGV